MSVCPLITGSAKILKIEKAGTHENAFGDARKFKLGVTGTVENLD